MDEATQRLYDELERLRFSKGNAPPFEAYALLSDYDQGRLTETQREVVILRVQFSRKEVARIRGTTMTAVCEVEHNALRRLIGQRRRMAL